MKLQTLSLVGLAVGLLIGVAGYCFDLSPRHALGTAAVGAIVAFLTVASAGWLAQAMSTPGFFWKRMSMISCLALVGTVAAREIEVRAGEVRGGVELEWYLTVARDLTDPLVVVALFALSALFGYFAVVEARMAKLGAASPSLIVLGATLAFLASLQGVHLLFRSGIM